MEYRVLGRTGIRVSCLCLGTDNFADPTPEDDAARILNRALDAGINLIDTGDTYADGEGEKIIGRTLARRGRRDQVLIATKVDHGRRRPGYSMDDPGLAGPNDHGHSRLNIIRACENSLRRLQTDYIDLYQVHRHSPDIPIDETLGALTDLVRQGKIRYIGCSTHPAWAVMEALMASERYGLARYICEQPPYNLLDRRIENELIPMCQRHGLGIITWGPMAMGVLAGRYKSARAHPENSRAALRGSFYADRVTQARNRAGAGLRAALRAGRPLAGPARHPVGEGPAGHCGASHRPAHPGASGRAPAGIRVPARRVAARRVRRAGASGERCGKLSQHGGLDEDAGRLGSRSESGPGGYGQLKQRLRPLPGEGSGPSLHEGRTMGRFTCPSAQAVNRRNRAGAGGRARSRGT